MRSFIILFVAAFFLTAAKAAAQSSELNLRSYSIRINAAPVKEAKGTAFIECTQKQTSNQLRPLGFYFSAEPSDVSTPILEVIDASTKKAIIGVALGDLLKESKKEAFDNNSRVTATFEVGKASKKAQMQIELISTADEGMPLGQKRMVNFKIRLTSAATITARISLKASGDARPNGSGGVMLSKSDKGESLPPVISLIATSSAKVTIGKVDKKNGVTALSWESSEVKADANAWATLFSFAVGGSTVGNYEKAVSQIGHVTSRVTASEQSPELTIVTTTNKVSTVPGDTVTYSISYSNIGSAFAQDVQLSNPIPDGVSLIESSVQSEGTEVEIERKAVQAPQFGEPTLVRWKVKNKILPGEEGKVTMKVIIK